jgi:hypothetical protein
MCVSANGTAEENCRARRPFRIKIQRARLEAPVAKGQATLPVRRVGRRSRQRDMRRYGSGAGRASATIMPHTRSKR